MTKEYLEISETTMLEAAAKTLRDRVLVRVLSHLGCRVSEALGLIVDDIDFASGTVSIVHLKSHVKVNCRSCGAGLGLRHDFCPKCGTKNELNAIQRSEKRRQRSLPLDQDTLDLIKTFLESQGPTLRNGKLYLFGINRHRAWQIVRECAQAAGLGELRNPETGKLRGVSPHRLRDAFAVHCMKTDDSGEGMRLLQEHLGHSSFNTTAKYRKIAGEEHKAWYEKLWDKVPEPDNGSKY
jgi:integrase/recombinase XerD